MDFPKHTRPLGHMSHQVTEAYLQIALALADDVKRFKTELVGFPISLLSFTKEDVKDIF